MPFLCSLSQDEPWNPEFLDSIFMNNDLLSELEDPNKISEITNSLMEYERSSPVSNQSDFIGFQDSLTGESDTEEFNKYLKPILSSSASDSGLSSDNLEW